MKSLQNKREKGRENQNKEVQAPNLFLEDKEI